MSKYFNEVRKQLASSSKATGQGGKQWDNAKVKTCAAKLPRGGVYQRLENLRCDKMRRVMHEVVQDVINNLGLPPELYNQEIKG
jgi:hypothetical protein